MLIDTLKDYNNTNCIFVFDELFYYPRFEGDTKD